MNRNSKEYKLAEKVINLNEALEIANKILKEHNMLGVLPREGTTFNKASKYHKKVRDLIKEI